VVEANLGVNNSSHEPFEDEFTPLGRLRPGVSDVDSQIDQYDEILEDQESGFVFWKRANKNDFRAIDMFPIVIDVPSALSNSGISLRLRVDGHDDSILILNNPSSISQVAQYLTDGDMFEYVTSEVKRQQIPLSQWKLSHSQFGPKRSFLILPLFPDDLDDEDVLGMSLVAIDNKGNETVVDSFKLTLKPMVWLEEAHNGVFWMGSARGEPSSMYNYTADTVAGEPVVQAIPIYPEFSWYSGPEPDGGKRTHVTYIHGFNTDLERAFTTSAEVYKRLWWSGYRGNFVALTWKGNETIALDHVCSGSPPGIIKELCISKFFPNMENAMKTSPRLKQFIHDKIIGDWGAEPQNVHMIAHSLGNLVALDALRLHAVEHDNRLIQHLVSVEAAVWEETFWDQSPKTYASDISFSEGDLMRGSWAFWFNQDAHPISESLGQMFNSFAPKDRVLTLMRFNDALPVLGTQCAYPLVPGSGPTAIGPCPRVERRSGRGTGSYYRVPVEDEVRVGFSDNRPDLGYEIPAMLNPDFPYGDHTYVLRNVSKPLGMVKISENSSENILSLDATLFGWRQYQHSWFLEGPLPEISQWYRNLTRETQDLPTGIIPAGME